MIWRWFWRELSTPSLVIVCLSLLFSVACAVCLGNLNERLTKGLTQQSREFLTADRVLRGAYPADEQWLKQAETLGLTISRQIQFSTMAYYNENLQLVEIKGVDSNYPLYGELVTNPPGLTPVKGKAFVDPKVLDLLSVKIGEDIELGELNVTIAGELLQEPDAGFSLFRSSPRIIITLDDVQQTGAIQVGSRLIYRYMFSGNDSALTQYDQFIKSKLKPAQSWITTKNYSNNTSAGILNRAQDFLLLAEIFILILISTAIAVAMNHYCYSRYQLLALLKTLGASQKVIRRLILGQWFIILVIAAILGSLLGLLLEQVLFYFLQNILRLTLPPASWMPWLQSLLLLFVLAALIGLRPYKQLLATQPSQIFRQDNIVKVWSLPLYLLVVLSIITVLMLLFVGFNPIWWSLLGGLFILAIIAGVMGWGTLFLLRRFAIKHLAIRLASNRLLRYPFRTITQFATFSLSLMLLILLMMVKTMLLERWQQTIPPQSPNYFMMNITRQQLPDVTTFLTQNDIQTGQFFPIILARLTAVNGQPVKKIIDKKSDGYEIISRELNLTAYEQAEPYNPIIKGQWPPQLNTVSIDESVAKRLNVTLGDTLTFTGNAQSFMVTIDSLRKVDWESLRPNFYFIFSEQTLAGQPQNGLSSFRYNGDIHLLTQFNRQFPTISLLDMRVIIQQIATVLAQVGQVLQLMVILVFCCGLLLLTAQLQVGMQFRRQELVICRILGANRSLLRNTLWIEFFILGFVSGLIAMLGGEIAIYLLQSYVFKLNWLPNMAFWIICPLVSGIVFSLVGVLLGLRLLKNKNLLRL